MSIAFTGGRRYRDAAGRVPFIVDLIMRVEGAVMFAGKDSVRFRVGDCPTGLDAIVRSYLRETLFIYKADWEAHGKAAGPIRNRNMLTGASGEDGTNDTADLLIVFPGGRGTADCEEKSLAYGIPVLHVPQ